MICIYFFATSECYLKYILYFCPNQLGITKEKKDLYIVNMVFQLMKDKLYEVNYTELVREEL